MSRFLIMFFAVIAMAFSTPAFSASVIENPKSIRVVDGDTFDVNGIRYRVKGYDSAEINGKCAYERKMAKKAKSKLKVAFDMASFVILLDAGFDHYGRKLAWVTVFTNGVYVPLEELMVNNQSSRRVLNWFPYDWCLGRHYQEDFE